MRCLITLPLLCFVFTKCQCSILDQLVQLKSVAFRHFGTSTALTTTQIAQNSGYNCEEHTVVTKDGYILTIHRLTGRMYGKSVTRNSPTVLLMHGIFSSSTGMISTGVNSPAGILSDYGFDVWMGNSRGTRHSRNHTRLSPINPELWNFNYNDMAIYDYTAFVDYILGYVGKSSLHHVGYSQGGLVMGGTLAYKPEYNRKIRSISFVASALYLKPYRNPLLDTGLRAFDKISRKNPPLIRSFPIYAYAYSIVKLLYSICYSNSPFLSTCKSITEAIIGEDDSLDYTQVPVWVKESDAISLNQFYQYAQRYVKGKLSFFDYGPRGNFKAYGTVKHPDLNFSVITAPALFVCGNNDQVIQTDGVFETIRSMPNVKNVVQLKGFSHLGFLFRDDIKEKVFDHVANHIMQYD